MPGRLDRITGLLLIAVVATIAPLRAQDESTLRAATPPPGAIWLDSLNLHNMIQALGQPNAGHSSDGHTISIRGLTFIHGVGTHSNSQLIVDLKGNATRFVSMVGVDDETNHRGSLIFKVTVDGKVAEDTGVLDADAPPTLISVDLAGARQMVLDMSGRNGETANGHGDWAGAMILLAPGATAWPQTVDPTAVGSLAKLPPVFPTNSTPSIHGAEVVGMSPDRPFLFLIPATGKAPLTYAAKPLPAGLFLNPHTGIISGALHTPGEYTVKLTVSSPAGKATRDLKLVCGDHKLALTPPMGWNAWNVYGDTVTADKIREQADWLVKSGLAAHGYQYIIIDDTWQGRRDAQGEIGPSLKFGDIKSLADYVHKKGLKLGILSSATEQTCSGYAGSLGHEQQDAEYFASVGIDYLKYDFCGFDVNVRQLTREDMTAPYGRMRAALDSVNRDIVYAITPFGLNNPWEWGKQVGANTWWTSASILDTWDSVSKDGFDDVDRGRSAGPGHWNDPGWLMIGRIGSDNPHFSRLKPAEQLSQMSLWCMLAAPLMLSCDMTQLNPSAYYPIATSLLTNDEVIDIDQDPLGQPARRMDSFSDSEVLVRPLAGGAQAVGIFNTKPWTQDVSIKWTDLGVTGIQAVRDVWQHKDLGAFPDSFSISVPPHDAALLRITDARHQP